MRSGKSETESNFFDQKLEKQEIFSGGQLCRNDWTNGLLVLLPTRLGIKGIAKEYYDPLVAFFNCPLNCGIMGGRPREAFYLVGMQDTHLIYLDPHTTHDAIPNEEHWIRKHHNQCHEKTGKKIHFTKLDPSLCFAFYLRCAEDYNTFESFLVTN